MRISLAILLGIFTSSFLVGAETAKKAPTLQDLSFISGTWEGTLGGVIIEEHWSRPRGDSMMGMFRILSGGKTTLYEFLAIESTPEGIVLRFKHFTPGPGLVSREKQGEAVTLPLVSCAGRVATFSGSNEGKPLSLVFTRTEDDRLSVDLHKETDGVKNVTSFVYHRVAH